MAVAQRNGLRLLHLPLISAWVLTLVGVHFQGLDW